MTGCFWWKATPCLEGIFKNFVHAGVHQYTWVAPQAHSKKMKASLRVGGGGTYIFGRTGMCCSNGWLFLQEILKHGSRFLPQKSLNMGQLFWLSPKLRNFRGFRHAKTPKITEFLKYRPIFEGKSLKMGTLFGQNHPYRWVWVLRLEWHTPVQLKSEYPPGLPYERIKFSMESNSKDFQLHKLIFNLYIISKQKT